jgi:Cupin
MARVVLEPCGINVPHIVVHGSEMLYVVEGENILTAFVDETGSKRSFNNHYCCLRVHSNASAVAQQFA